MAYSSWRTRPVAGIGIVGIDHVAVTDRWEPDGKSVASYFFEQVGGPVPVALMAMARLGLETPPRFHTALGGDADGDRILQILKEDGVDTRPVRRLPKDFPSGHSVVVLNSTNGTRSVTNLPANYFDSDAYIPLHRQRYNPIRESGLLHIDGKGHMSQHMVALEMKEKHETIASWDLGSSPEGVSPLRSVQKLFQHYGFSFYDILIASKKGAKDCFPDGNPFEQTRRFIEMGAVIAGVTLGTDGVVIAARDENGGEPFHLPAFNVENVVDTCGAGDLFHGAFLWAYRAGQSVIESATFAQAAVALRIQKFGNRLGHPTREEVEDFLRTATTSYSGNDAF